MVGARTAQAISDVAARALLKAAQAGGPGLAAVRTASTLKAFEGFEKVADQVTRPIVEMLASIEGAPPELQHVFKLAAKAPQQVESMFRNLVMWMVLQPLVGAVITPFLQRFVNVSWQLPINQVMPLSPLQAAAAVLRSEIDEGEGIGEANQSGVSALQFRRMLALVGNPPGLEVLQEAVRRGVIDQARFTRGVQQSDLRNEWTDVLTALRVGPFSGDEAVAGVVQTAMPEGQARMIWEQNGLDPDLFDIAVAIRGNPPGPETLAELFHRKIIDRGRLVLGLRQSNLKNEWIEDFIRSTERIPPQDTVRRMFNGGAIDRPAALTMLEGLGYPAKTAGAMLDLETADRTKGARDFTAAQVLNFYRDRSLKRADAKGLLVDLGYDADEAELLLDNADLDRLQRARAAAVSKVHSAYVAHRLDYGDASNALDGIGVAPDEREDLIELWEIEREANVRVPTPAQIIAAVKKGMIDFNAGGKRLVEQGYSPADARLVLFVGGAGTGGA